MQDRGEPPGDDADAYPQVLAGLKLAARHAAEPLLDSLLTWRRDALAQAAKAKPEVMILRKRVCDEGGQVPGQSFVVKT